MVSFKSYRDKSLGERLLSFQPKLVKLERAIANVNCSLITEFDVKWAPIESDEHISGTAAHIRCSDDESRKIGR